MTQTRRHIEYSTHEKRTKNSEHYQQKEVEPTMTLKRILMVEDETDIQEIARLSLEVFGGFCVEVCDHGKNALALAQRFQPDLVLLDVMMAEMDGPATLRALRATTQFRHTPIIFMTAKAQPSEVAALRALGALDVIAKPFDPLTLPHTVEKLWQNHHLAISLRER